MAEQQMYRGEGGCPQKHHLSAPRLANKSRIQKRHTRGRAIGQFYLLKGTSNNDDFVVGDPAAVA